LFLVCEILQDHQAVFERGGRSVWAVVPVRLIAGIRLHEKASLDKLILSSDVKEVCQGSNDSSAVYKYAVCNSQKEKYLIRNARNKNI